MWKSEGEVNVLEGSCHRYDLIWTQWSAGPGHFQVDQRAADGFPEATYAGWHLSTCPSEGIHSH